MSESKMELSPAQIARNELMQWFDQEANQDERHAAIVTYSGILAQMIDINNVKNQNNDEQKRKLAEFSQDQHTGQEQI